VPPVATRPTELYATPTWAALSGQVTVSEEGGVAVTVVFTVEVLLPVLGVEETVAAFVTVGGLGGVLGLLTTSTTVATPLAARVPRRQVTVLVLLVKEHDDDPAGDGVAETYVVPAGRGSVTVTLVARLEPVFVTTML
jgi:hypothetical protein